MRLFVRFGVVWALVLLAMLVPPVATPAAEVYNPSDVAVIDKILRDNDAKNGFLAARGWKAGEPETWRTFTDPEAKPKVRIGVLWKNGRVDGLDLYGTRLTGALDLTGLDGLRFLVLGFNEVPEIKGLAGLTKLQTLWAYQCGTAASEDLSGLLSLRDLNWGGNQLASLGDLPGLTTLSKLQALDLRSNKLKDVRALGGLTNLRELTVSGNQLTDIGELGTLAKLTKLDVGYNKELKTLGDLNRLTKLQMLDARCCALEDIGDISGLTSLQTLKVSRNKLTRLGDLTRLTQLRQVDAEWNSLTAVEGLGAAKRLESLDLRYNDLTDLGELSGPETLAELDVSSNDLTRLPNLAPMKALRQLRVASNKLSDHNFLNSLQDGMLETLEYSGDELPSLTLADAPLKNLKNLTIESTANLESVNLSNQPLQELYLDSDILEHLATLTAGRITSPGPIELLIIGGGRYSMVELRDLYEKLRPKTVRVISSQSVPEPGFPSDLKLDTPYALADISPALAADYEAAGPTARLTVGDSRLARMAGDKSCGVDYAKVKAGIEKTKSSAAVFQDGRLTFTRNGKYFFTISTEDLAGSKEYAAVSYRRSIPVGVPPEKDPPKRWSPDQPADGPAPEGCVAADVAVIDKILRDNDAKNGVLAGKGWRAGKPETWRSFAGPFGMGERRVGVVCTGGRVEQLELEGARLEGVLDLTGLTALKTLGLNHNALSEIKGLPEMTGLEILRAEWSRLTSIGDLSGLTRLRVLDVGMNQLEDIGDLSRLINLEELDVSWNRLTRLGDLSGLTKLRSLQVGRSWLKGLGDLGGLTELETLDISGNRLTTVKGLAALGKLKSLKAGGNDDLIDLGDLTCGATLTELDVSFGKLTRLPNLARMTSLKELNVAWNPFAQNDFLDSLPNGVLEELTYSGEQLPALRLADHPLKGLKKLVIFRPERAELVDLSGQPLEEIKLSGFSSDGSAIPADRFANPGSLGKLSVETGKYTMTGVRALFEKLHPKNIQVSVSAPALWGEFPKPLKVDTVYALADIDPLLAADYEAAGPGAKLTALRKLSAPSEDEKWESAFDKSESPSYTFQDGRLTFSREGEYKLALTCEGFPGAKGLVSVRYKDILQVGAR